jgi:hypothetical protein
MRKNGNLGNGSSHLRHFKSREKRWSQVGLLGCPNLPCLSPKMEKKSCLKCKYLVINKFGVMYCKYYGAIMYSTFPCEKYEGFEK